MARPDVRIRQQPYGDRHIAWCYEPACPWAFSDVTKTYVQQQARWHREKHRAEVKASG